LKNLHSLSHSELQEKLAILYGSQNVVVDENFIIEINCDSIHGQQKLEFLVKDKNSIKKLPNIKRIRIDNVASMINEIRFFLKYSLPDNFQIMNFNVNGALLDMSLFIDLF